ncbi:hypothetical protein KCP75_10845 [Salmonella enterica subsp. enterica]|nr:hypothetical protein KCP75_10845 [Salmonella enterica subsp. enterica]
MASPDGGYSAAPPGLTAAHKAQRRFVTPDATPAAASRSCKNLLSMQPDQPDRYGVTCNHQSQTRQRERPSSQPTKSGGRVTDQQTASANSPADKCPPSGKTISSLNTRSSAALTSSFGPLRSINAAVCNTEVAPENLRYTYIDRRAVNVRSTGVSCDRQRPSSSRFSIFGRINAWHFLLSRIKPLNQHIKG